MDCGSLYWLVGLVDECRLEARHGSYDLASEYTVFEFVYVDCKYK